MISVRAPHRISLFGGGSDTENHIDLNDSFSSVFGMGIKTYCYVSAVFPSVPVKNKFRVSYQRVENAQKLSELEHDLARETLKYFNFDDQIHISSMSDAPAGTGLGTSSAFTVCLVSLMSSKLGLALNNKQIAEAAIDIERNKANLNGGIQDQIWSSFGGIGCFNFKYDKFKLIKGSNNLERLLTNNSYLCYLGGNRSSSSQHDTLKTITNISQKEISENKNNLANQSLNFSKTESKLSSDDLDSYLKESLCLSWIEKKKAISINSQHESLLEALEKKGLSFKLCGAGDTGFLYFYISDEVTRDTCEKILSINNLTLIKVQPDLEGVKVIYKEHV